MSIGQSTLTWQRLCYLTPLLVCACRDTPVQATEVPGVYALNRKTGSDTLILNADGTFRHRWQIDSTPVGINTGRWRLDAPFEGRAQLTLEQFVEWWGLTGDPDKGPALVGKAEHIETSISRGGSDRVEITMDDDQHLYYQRVLVK